MADRIKVLLDDLGQKITLPPASSTEPFKLLIADDEKEVHLVTRMVLGRFTFEGRPVEILSAYSGEETCATLARHPDIAVVLLDVVMEEEDTGLQVARRIRRELDNQLVRIVLRTGQPGRTSEEEVVRDFDINDYKAKTDLTAQRLTTTVMMALRTWQRLQCLDRQRRGLEHIIVSSVRLFEMVSVKQFLEEALGRLIRLLFLDTDDVSGTGALAACRRGDQDPFRIVASSGTYAGKTGDPTALMPADAMAAIMSETGVSRQVFLADGVLSLHKVPDRYQVLFYVGRADQCDQVDRELVQVFCLNTVLSLESLRRIAELQREIEMHVAHTQEVERYQDELEMLVRERTTVFGRKSGKNLDPG